MTPEERAFNIIDRWRCYMHVFGPSKGFPKNEGSMLDDIAKEIKQACEEVRKEESYRKVLNVGMEIDLAYERGFNDAREMAAKIADEICDPDDGWPITKYAEEIRAMKPTATEEKKCPSGLIDCNLKNPHNHNESGPEKASL